MWNANIKVIKIFKMVHMTSGDWFGYFEYVGYVLHGITLIAVDYFFHLITINFNWSTEPWSIVRHQSPAQNFANHFWHIQSVTAPSQSTTQIFFELQFVFTFLEIIKHNLCPKCCFFLPSSILKMATQKFTNFDEFS